MLCQRFLQSDNQEYEANNQERLFRSSNLQQLGHLATVAGGMPPPCHTEHCSQKCCLSPTHKDTGATNAMCEDTPGKAKKQEKIPSAAGMRLSMRVSAELSPHHTPTPCEHYVTTGEGTEMGMEIPAGCNKNHLIFAFHLPVLFLMMAGMLQKAPDGGGA